MIENWDAAIVVWTLRNRENGRFLTVTRTINDPAPCDAEWEVETVDYIDVETE